MIPVLVLHGPNLNLLGEREPDVYGTLSLKEINQNMALFGKNLGMEIHTYQSNVEGELVNALHEARSWARGILFNPAGYTTTSVALRDAILAIRLPVVEVHLSNIYKREEFRQHSIIAPVCVGSISGFGWRSYALALHALVYLMDDQPAEGG
jgi:3-dehydroquinate dehydratase-2